MRALTSSFAGVAVAMAIGDMAVEVATAVEDMVAAADMVAAVEVDMIVLATTWSVSADCMNRFCAADLACWLTLGCVQREYGGGGGGGGYDDRDRGRYDDRGGESPDFFAFISSPLCPHLVANSSDHFAFLFFCFQAAGAVVAAVAEVTRERPLVARRNVARESVAAGAPVDIYVRGPRKEALTRRRSLLRSTSADRRARIAMWNAERESGGPG
jgi:hypothetical protein